MLAWKIVSGEDFLLKGSNMYDFAESTVMVRSWCVSTHVRMHTHAHGDTLTYTER